MSDTTQNEVFNLTVQVGQPFKLPDLNIPAYPVLITGFTFPQFGLPFVQPANTTIDALFSAEDVHGEYTYVFDVYSFGPIVMGTWGYHPNFAAAVEGVTAVATAPGHSQINGSFTELTIQDATLGNPAVFDFTTVNVTINVTATPCYCPGTLILTTWGEVAVEDLSIDDQVITASGLDERVRWIGRRSYAGRFIAGNHLMLPVTIRAGAIADGVPHTDLQVSPGHGMWVDGQLVPAWRLVNGVSVTQAQAVEVVTYYHVELHTHALLLANGAAAESFLEETGFRGQFHNAAEFSRLYPDAPAMLPLQGRLEDGFALQRIQERVAARAGLWPQIEPVGAMHGYVDQAGPWRVCGWAQDTNSPEEPVALEISVDGFSVMCVLANGYRADLRGAGIGSGCHAFDMVLPRELDGVVQVRRVTDLAVLAVADAPTNVARAA